jgi:hypothetical protein
VAPATSESISSLNRITVTADTDRKALGECNISFEEFELGDVCVTLPCSHKFKEDQIVQWLKLHANCPTCRINIG